MNRFKILIATIIICIVAIFLVIAITRWTTKQYNDAAIIQQIKALNRWETSTYTVEQIIDNGNSGNLFQQFLFGNRILLIAHGTVIGGFDLSNLQKSNININGSSITINLPAAQILSSSLNESQTRVYDRQKGILVPTNNNLESDARVSAMSKIRQAACSGGILTHASENAKKSLSSMLESLGFTHITINIPKSSC